MKAYKGSKVFEGYALGRLAVYSAIKVEKAVGLGKEKEFERFCKAREETVRALDTSYAEALEKLGEKDLANIYFNQAAALKEEE